MAKKHRRQDPAIPGNDPESATDTAWAMAATRETVISRLDSLPRSDSSEIDQAARQLSLGPAMIYRWLARYRRDPHVSALLKQSPGRKLGTRVLPPSVEQIIEDTIQSFYLKPERPSLAALHRRIWDECRKRKLPPPSYNTIHTRVRGIDEQTATRVRIGPRAVRNRLQPIVSCGPRPDYPLDLYQVDHTKVDVIVVDECDRRPLGRPWLTVVLDVASRMIAGYHLTFDPPCSTSVALALSHAVLPKEKYLQELGLQAEWPISGLPRVVHVDNAHEFHARALKRGCQEHGIQLTYRPPLQPHYGGHIERLIGTLMKEMHLLPGTTFSSVKERGEYDSEARAVMSMQELEQWLALQITGMYHQSVHRHLRCSPLQAWRRLHRPDRIRHPDDSSRFYIDFLPVEQRLIRRDGIQLFRIHYWDNTLSPLAGRSTRRHLIRYDPRDLSRIFVKGVVERGYISVPYRDLAHPRITLAEQRAALRELAQAKRLSLSEGNIFQTVASQRLLVEHARKKTVRAKRQTGTPSKSNLHASQPAGS